MRIGEIILELLHNATVFKDCISRDALEQVQYLVRRRSSRFALFGSWKRTAPQWHGPSIICTSSPPCETEQTLYSMLRSVTRKTSGNQNRSAPCSAEQRCGSQILCKIVMSGTGPGGGRTCSICATLRASARR